MQLFLGDSSSNLLGALGIDWQVLLANAVSFLIILWLLSKFVYPVILKLLDTKADELAEASRLQTEAQVELDKAKNQAHKLVAKARQSADDLLAAAQTEADETLTKARRRAESQAERIVTEAREQLSKDVQAASRSLRAETAILIAQATATVLDEKLTAGRDADLIARSLEDRS